MKPLSTSARLEILLSNTNLTDEQKEALRNLVNEIADDNFRNGQLSVLPD